MSNYQSNTIYAAKEFAKNEYLNRIAMYNSDNNIRAIRKRYGVISNICSKVDETNECYKMKCEDMSRAERTIRRVKYLSTIRCVLSKAIRVDDMAFVIVSFLS